MRLPGVELFKAGKQTDSAGMTKVWSVEELQQMSDAYNECAASDLHNAPLILQHSGTTPFGWLGRTYVEGDRLFGDYEHLTEEAVSGLRNKTLRKRSIGLYPPSLGQNPSPGQWCVRHLAFVPVPAVKGLAEHDLSKLAPDNFSEAGHFDFGQELEGVVEFGGYNPIRDTLLSVRDLLIEQYGLERADKALPLMVVSDFPDLYSYVNTNYFEAETERIRARINELENRFMRALATVREQQELQNYEDNAMSHQQTSTSAAEGDTSAADPNSVNSFSEDAISDPSVRQIVNQMGEELKALRTENAQLRGQMETQEAAAFVEGLIGEGKVAPKDKDSEVQKILSIPNDADSSFSFGEQQITPRQLYLNQLSDRLPIVDQSELPTTAENAPSTFSEGSRADGSFDAQSERQYEQISAIAAEKGISFSDALNQFAESRH